MLASLALAGCVILAVRQREEGLFSHRLHLDKIKQVKCEMCHPGAKRKGDPMECTVPTCVSCHEFDPPPSDKCTPERCDGCHMSTKRPWALEERDLIYEHTSHTSKGYECKECHTAIEEVAHVGHEQLPTMEEGCLVCHTAKGLGKDCKVCHEEIREGKPPRSHTAGYTQIHGSQVNGPDATSQRARCALCHGEQGCTDCHSTSEPSDHGPHWRVSGHGLAAGIDRSRCMECHGSASCDRCHLLEPPRTHRGTWGSPQNTHCRSCHVEPLGLSGTGCSTCHSSSAHPTTPSQPRDLKHASATDCRSCHLTLRHPDPGGDCQTCHR